MRILYLHPNRANLVQKEARATPRREVYMSHVINAAIREGLRVERLHLPGARFLDIGITENLMRAMRMQLNKI